MDIFTLLGTIAINNDQANKALDDTSQKAEDTGKQIDDALGKIGTVALGVGKAVVTAGAVVGGAWLAAIESTREYRSQMGLLDSSFQAAGHSSTEAKNTYSELNAVLGDTEQAVEAAQHIALIADNEKEMNELVAIGTGIFNSYGQSLPLEGLYEAIQHTSSLGEVQGSLSDGLEWAGITVEDFNKELAKCSTEEERQDLIMKTLKDTYGEAAVQYQETNADVMEARKAQERLTDAFAELGRIGEPILTAIKNGVAFMVETAVPKLEALIEKVKDTKKWIQDNKDTVDTWTAVIIAAAVSVGSFLLVLKWGAIMSAATKAIQGVKAAVVLFNAALRANPIGLVISLLAGLVAGFLYLWQNNEGFRNFWIGMWDKIKSVGGSAVDWIKGKFNDFKGALSTVKDTFGKIKDAIADKIEGAKESVSKAIKKIKDLFPMSIGKIFSNLKIPKISVSGGKAPYGIAGMGKLPNFDIKWNAKGAVLDEPTIFGMSGNTFLGGGEAGKEAVAPIDILQAYIREAVKENDQPVVRALIEQFERLMDFLDRAMPSTVTLDSGALVGSLLPAVDTGLASRWEHTRRGNVR